MKQMVPNSSYLRRCIEVREQSHDPHRQVGAVIVDVDGSILAEGTNAPPRQLALSKAQSMRAIADDPQWKYFMLEHAERNAINSAFASGISLGGTTMYATLYPCADCARAIVSAGISRLILPKDGGNVERDEKWTSHFSYASRIFDLAGVRVDFE